MESRIPVKETTFPLVFAAKNRSNDIRLNSSSGGAFEALASKIIERGGVVYGCAFDDELKAVHIRCETIEDCRQCMGSKYSQSYLGTTIATIIQDVRDGRLVLFTGTPCQVDAVNKVCSKGVLTVDIVCHGVPSPLLFKTHVRFLESKIGAPVVEYEHRPKNKGWGHHERFRTKGGASFQDTRLSESWKRLFYDNRMLRPSCYACPYASEKRISDITIADYWGIEKTELGAFKDGHGVSLVMVNSHQGLELLGEADMELRSSTLQDALPGNPMLTRPSKYVGDRNAVWVYLYENGYQAMLRAFHFYPSALRRFGMRAIRKMRQLLKG